MPCTKCANGKWRWGSGPCQYDTKADCERAHGGASMTEVQTAQAAMNVEILTAKEDGDKGIIEALVSAYNVKYRMGFFAHHTIVPGAFAASIAANPTIPLFWMHAWDWSEQPPIGHGDTEEVEQPKPGLKVSGEMYLDQPGVPGVFRSLKAGALKQWSIAYRILATRADEDDEENTFITEAELLEASSVLRGANPETETLKVASDGTITVGGGDGVHPGTLKKIAKSLGVDVRELYDLVIQKPDAAAAPPDTGTGDKTPDEGAEQDDPDKAPDVETSEVDDLVDARRDITEARNRRRLLLTW